MWEYQAACQAKINATILPIELSPCRSGQRNRAELFYIFPAMLVALAISVPKFFEIQADERWVVGKVTQKRKEAVPSSQKDEANYN